MTADRTFHILVVDDNHENRYLLEQIFQALGHTVTGAANGREALESARRTLPDAVISDVLMPEMDGFELCRQWKADERLAARPFIFYSATYSDPRDEQFARELGADRYIIKPQRPEILINAVREAIGQAAQHPAVPRSREPEPQVLQEYSRVLFRKLEHKIRELETEIEARRRAEQKMALQAELLDAAIDSILLFDENGAIVYANRSAAELRGYSREEILALNVKDLNDPDNATAYPERLGMIIKTGFALYEAVHVRKDGTPFNVEVLARTITVSGKPHVLTSNRDVSGRRKAIAALSESEERFRTLFEVSPDVMYTISLDGLFLALNPAFERLTGWKREEWIGRPFAGLIHPDDMEVNAANFRRVLEGNVISSVETRILAKSGAYLTGEFSSAPYKRGGLIAGTHGVARDVTERKRAEESVRESEEKFRSIFNNAVEGILLVDSDEMRFTECNPACARMTGYTPEEFTALGLRDIHPADTLADVRSSMVDFLNDTCGFHRQLRMRRKDGSAFDAEMSVAPASFGGRKYLMLIFTDVTERIRAEREIVLYRDNLERLVSDRTRQLRRANEDLNAEIAARQDTEERLNRERTLLRTLIDTIPDRIYAKDRKGRYTLANLTMLRALGLDDFHDLIGRTDFDLYPGEQAERLHREEQKIVKSGAPLLDREELTDAAGTDPRWLLKSKTPFRNDEGSIMGLVGVDRDITALKRTEENLQRAKEQAEAANAAKSTFLANISHEIRTPMNAILGFTQLLLRDPALGPGQRERLEVINRSGEHLVRLLNNVLDIAKIETGHASVDVRPFDPQALAGEVEAIFRAKADEKRLAFSITGPDAVPAWIVSDELKIRQILINLVGNAVKFTDRGSVTVRLRLEDDGPHKIFLAEVEDTGRGVRPEDRESLFGEFIQGNTGQAESGSGLGLALSRRLARLLGGDVTMTDAAGGGSVFRLRVPVRVARRPVDDPGKQPRRRVLRLAPDQKRRTVLVADDNADNRRYLAELLSTVGFKVVEAGDGEAAVAGHAGSAPDLIFMDLNMAPVDGYQATARIRAARGGAAVPIIAVTANALAETRDEIMKSGMNAIIVKPFKDEEVFDALGKILGARYEYDDGPADTTPAADMKLEIGRIPDDLAASIIEAAERLDIRNLLESIERAGSAAPAAAAWLRGLARRYEYDKIAAFLKERSGNDG